MSGTKYKKFVTTPIEGKPVTAVPGIGKVLGRSLEKEGIDSAEKLLYRYRSSPGKFKDVVKGHGGNAKSQRDALAAMDKKVEKDLQKTTEMMGCLRLSDSSD